MTRALWVPWADRHPVALRASQQRTITPVGLVRHTAVSNRTLVVPTGEVRWHFYLAKDGKLTQFFPVNRPAACQLDGNYWTVNGQGRGFLSCESWDGAGVVWDGRNTNALPPWNDAQLATWSRLDVWIHTEWGVPLVPATAARGHGFGQHSDFTSRTFPRWNEQHACVAPARKRQMAGILSWSKQLAAANTPPEDDDMTPEQAKQLATLSTQVEQLHSMLTRITDLTDPDKAQHGTGWFLAKTLQDTSANAEQYADLMEAVQTWGGRGQTSAKFTDDKVDRVIAALQGLYAKVDGLSAKVDALSSGSGEAS